MGYRIQFRSPLTVAVVAMLSFGFAVTGVDAANEVLATGGSLGVLLSLGLVDIEGDGDYDIFFQSYGEDHGLLTEFSPFGLVGNIGGPPGTGLAWIRGTDTHVTVDGVGRTESVESSRGAFWPSDDNWSKVHLSSGDGWVKWRIGITRDLMTPLIFVRESDEEDLSAAQAFAAAGFLGTLLSPGLIDVDGDGTPDVDFVSTGVDHGYLDEIATFGLVGNIGGSPGEGLAWVRGSDNQVTVDGVGRDEIIASFRGAIWPSDDNWSKVHFSSGDGWVQWRFGTTTDLVTPLVFVREADGENLSAQQARARATQGYHPAPPIVPALTGWGLITVILLLGGILKQGSHLKN